MAPGYLETSRNEMPIDLSDLSSWFSFEVLDTEVSKTFRARRVNFPGTSGMFASLSYTTSFAAYETFWDLLLEVVGLRFLVQVTSASVALPLLRRVLFLFLSRQLLL